MTLFTSLVVAFALGYLVHDRHEALLVFIALWLLLAAVETTILIAITTDGLGAAYPVVQAMILAVGIVVVPLGSSLRSRLAASRRRP